jgi:tetratricopeptide (TPR) repeat protein
LHCVNCNSIISKKSNFCPNCGTRIDKKSVSTKKFTKNNLNTNPVYIILFAGILAILTVILILDSNVPEHRIENNTNQSNQEAKQLFSKIEALKNKLANDPKNINLHIELGNNLFDVKHYRDAILYYKKALNFVPENVEVRIDLAVSYYNLQIVDTALVEIKRALKLNPDHQQGLYNIGVMYYNSGNKPKAKENWEKLIQLHDGTQTAETAKQLLENI